MRCRVEKSIVRAGVGVLLCAALLLSFGCGGSKSGSQADPGPLSSNWQFTLLTPPSDTSFTGGPSGGFLLQKGNSVTGAWTYSVAAAGTASGACAAGVATVTGTVDGQNVTLTVAAGTQTFTLTGTLSSDSSSMGGSYMTTAGPQVPANGGVGTVPCGTAQTPSSTNPLNWTAVSVPPLTGSFQGSFHSSVNNQDLPISGSLIQSPNMGASNATVTGTLSSPGYLCFDNASVNGTISGSSVILEIIGPNGLIAGGIGSNGSVPSLPSVGPAQFMAQSGANSAVLHAYGSQSGYFVTTTTCPLSASNAPGDSGNACLALNGGNGCTQPISFSPDILTFPPQMLESAPTSQTITLTNTDPSGSTQNLTLTWSDNPSDFSGLANYTEQDTCGSPSFSLSAGQSCTITITFSPQQSCPRDPFTDGLNYVPPVKCPSPLPPPSLTVATAENNGQGIDGNGTFGVLIRGTGLSDIVPSLPELDFGNVAAGEQDPPQTLTFTNQSALPIQILPPPVPGTPCVASPTPPFLPGAVPGLQVVYFPTGGASSATCDLDSTTNKPNFQISSDNCSGTILTPQESCTVNVTFAQQPSSVSLDFSGANDIFLLQFSTLQCTSTTTFFCEIDSGRLPVQLRANEPSPLRMSPAAGINFGSLNIGVPSAPQTITIYNDPSDPNAANLTFRGIQASSITGDYTQTNTCGSSLPSGSSCTITVTFTPSKRGLDPGTVTISPQNPGQVPQFIFLLGKGK